MNKHKVVLVMRDAALADHLQARLNDFNCIVSASCTNVKEGLELAQSMSADIVFLDPMVKGQLDGMEAVRLLKYNLGIPVVLISGFANTPVFRLMKQMYSGSFLNLPVQDSDLEIALDLALSEVTPLRSGVVLRRMESEVSLLAN